MRLVFAGTPDFAAVAMDAMVAAGHELVAVLTQPDRRAGRGMRLMSSAVKERARAQGFLLLQPHSLREPSVQGELSGLFAPGRAELMVVAAYGLLLPPPVLGMPRLGCINIHASLLPRWRGAAPVERAIIAGDTETGISIMQMDQGLDTGPILLKRVIPIEARDTGGSLRARLAGLGATAILETLSSLGHGGVTAKAQPALGVSTAAKIDKAEAALDFSQSALELDRKIRAFDPEPGAFAEFSRGRIKIWRALPAPPSAPAPALPPGTVRASRGGSLDIACGSDGTGTLMVEELQKPGGKRLSTAQFLASFSLAAGDRFASAR